MKKIGTDSYTKARDFLLVVIISFVVLFGCSVGSSGGGGGSGGGGATATASAGSLGLTPDPYHHTFTVAWQPPGLNDVDIHVTPKIPPSQLDEYPSSYINVTASFKGKVVLNTDDPYYQCFEALTVSSGGILIFEAEPEASAVLGQLFLVAYNKCGPLLQTDVGKRFFLDASTIHYNNSDYVVLYTFTGTPKSSGPNPVVFPDASTQRNGPSGKASYETTTPGENCDTKGGTWMAINSTAQCTSEETIITKTLTTTGSSGGWGEQRFQPPGHSLPTAYRVGVTIGAIIDPVNTIAACAGIAVHMSQDGSSEDTVQVCSDGKASIISVVDGQEVNRVEWFVPVNSIYVLSADVTPDTLTLTVNNGEQHSAKAYSSATNFISLNVFWQNAGANASFADFHYVAS